jgi:hypothetical protein
MRPDDVDLAGRRTGIAQEPFNDFGHESPLGPRFAEFAVRRKRDEQRPPFFFFWIECGAALAVSISCSRVKIGSASDPMVLYIDSRLLARIAEIRT